MSVKAETKDHLGNGDGFGADDTGKGLEEDKFFGLESLTDLEDYDGIYLI